MLVINMYIDSTTGSSVCLFVETRGSVPFLGNQETIEIGDYLIGRYLGIRAAQCGQRLSNTEPSVVCPPQDRGVQMPRDRKSVV